MPTQQAAQSWKDSFNKVLYQGIEKGEQVDAFSLAKSDDAKATARGIRVSRKIVEAKITEDNKKCLSERQNESIMQPVPIRGNMMSKIMRNKFDAFFILWEIARGVYGALKRFLTPERQSNTAEMIRIVPNAKNAVAVKHGSHKGSFFPFFTAELPILEGSNMKPTVCKLGPAPHKYLEEEYCATLFGQCTGKNIIHLDMSPKNVSALMKKILKHETEFSHFTEDARKDKAIFSSDNLRMRVEIFDHKDNADKVELDRSLGGGSISAFIVFGEGDNRVILKKFRMKVTKGDAAEEKTIFWAFPVKYKDHISYKDPQKYEPFCQLFDVLQHIADKEEIINCTAGNNRSQMVLAYQYMHSVITSECKKCKADERPALLQDMKSRSTEIALACMTRVSQDIHTSQYSQLENLALACEALIDHIDPVHVQDARSTIGMQNGFIRSRS